MVYHMSFHIILQRMEEEYITDRFRSSLVQNHNGFSSLAAMIILSKVEAVGDSTWVSLPELELLNFRQAHFDFIPFRFAL